MTLIRLLRYAPEAATGLCAPFLASGLPLTSLLRSIPPLVAGRRSLAIFRPQWPPVAGHSSAGQGIISPNEKSLAECRA